MQFGTSFRYSLRLRSISLSIILMLPNVSLCQYWSPSKPVAYGKAPILYKQLKKSRTDTNQMHILLASSNTVSNKMIKTRNDRDASIYVGDSSWRLCNRPYLQKRGNAALLQLADNGTGFHTSVLNREVSGSIGMELIRGLSKEIHIQFQISLGHDILFELVSEQNTLFRTETITQEHRHVA